MGLGVGVIFDMDGVIFDSERFVIDVWKIVAEQKNLVGMEEACIECIGTNYDLTRKIMVGKYGEVYDEYRVLAREIQAELLAKNGMPQKPGVRDLLQFLKDHDVKLALASSTKAEVVKSELQDAGFLDYFQVVIGGDMVSKSKPEPDIFLKACEELGCVPSETYVIEDSYNGIRAASRAGMKPIMVPDILQPDEEIKSLAQWIFPSLMEVKHFFENNLTIG